VGVLARQFPPFQSYGIVCCPVTGAQAMSYITKGCWVGRIDHVRSLSLVLDKKQHRRSKKYLCATFLGSEMAKT
jgi:hypothetical protein